MAGKLKLNLDQLEVDSFDTISARAAGRGTVRGEQCTCYTNCTCPGCPTCYASCNGTCNATCPGTCAYTCDDATCAYTCDDATCAGTCDCGTYDYTCEGCTVNDGTCRGYGTCGIYPCRPIP